MFKWLKRIFTVTNQVNRHTNGYWTEYKSPKVNSDRGIDPELIKANKEAKERADTRFKERYYNNK